MRGAYVPARLHHNRRALGCRMIWIMTPKGAFLRWATRLLRVSVHSWNAAMYVRGSGLS